jgi:hypothetical protein
MRGAPTECTKRPVSGRAVVHADGVYKSSQVIGQRRASSPGANSAGEMAEPDL